MSLYEKARDAYGYVLLFSMAVWFDFMYAIAPKATDRWILETRLKLDKLDKEKDNAQ